MSTAGIVKVWNEEKGFGFISAAEAAHDIFCHRLAFGGTGRLIEGETVYFDVVPDDKKPDKLGAKNVTGPGVDYHGQPKGHRQMAGMPGMPMGGYQMQSPQQHITSQPAGMVSGVVTKWNDDKGFGFVKPDDGTPDMFCHRMAFGGKGRLIEGGTVYYEIGADTKKVGRQGITRVVGPGVEAGETRMAPSYPTQPAACGAALAGQGGTWGAGWDPSVQGALSAQWQAQLQAFAAMCANRGYGAGSPSVHYAGQDPY
eukprot:TRINITY_DN3485_c0_g1_i2.p2 TRINITY_DN3485_c0_g1~~TRINITY_DN3485_c0_g1_i2.p2  ORF type:complete len:286 (+),score=56.13 TRINITY_DN3485_c0_g1_i2:93-860(+)